MSPILPVHLDDRVLAVATEALVKRFGRESALAGVDLHVPQDSVYVLVGPNGAGKSTTLRTLMNVIRPDAGIARVFGMDTRRSGPRVRAQIGYMPERHDRGPSWMTVRRLLDQHAAYYPAWDAGYADTLVRRFEVRPDRRFGALSKGGARRVQLIMALAHRPPLLLLDEPTDGLDPVVRDATLGLLAEHLADTPTTVLISTHQVYEIERLVDHVGALSNGRLLAQLPRDQLHQRLLRYRLEVPDGWTETDSFDGTVLRRSGSGRSRDWTIWGEQAPVRHALTGAGVTVRDVAPLSLDEAVITLLSSTST